MAFTESGSASYLNALTAQNPNTITGAYLGLSTTTPTTSGTNFTEPDSADGYQRSRISSAANVMGSPSGGTITNDEIIFFPEATGSWGTITHWGLWTSETGGTLIAYGALSSSVSVNANYVPLFRAGHFTLTLT